MGNIHCRINDKLLSRFEEALEREGMSKTQVIINAVHEFVTKSENRKDASKMKKFHVIFNNQNSAPDIINEFDHISVDLKKVGEDQINDEAWERQATRAHLYEARTNEYDVTAYHYITTILTTFEPA